MTPEEISLERSRRLRSAFLDQEFGGAKALLDDNAFGGVIEDKESFLTSSAVAGWAGAALGRRVNPASPEWQGVKDGIVRGYFKNQAASNVSDNDMFGMIAADYQAQDKVINASRMAAARGESWLGKFREMETKESGSMIPGRMTNYIGLAREAHDEMAAKVNPYRNTIKTVAEMARNIDTDPDGMDWGSMAAELIKVPKENRPYVLEALSNQASGEMGDIAAIQSLAKSFDRGMSRYLDSAASSVFGVAMSDIEASAASNPFLTSAQSGEVLAASSTVGDYMDLRDDIRDIATGNLAPLKAIRFAGMNISGAVENIPMTIGSFVPYVGAAVTIGSFQRSTYNEIRRSNPTMSRDDANSIATISAPIQAITEIASDRFLFGRLPNLKRAFTQPIFSTTGALAMFTTRAAIGTATEVGEEFAQGITPLVVQSVSKALGDDLPGSDWDGFFSDFAENVPELISTILPLAIVGAGTGQLSDFRAGRQMARSTDMLIAAQYSPESAAKISELANAGKWSEAEDAMRIDWARINAKGADVSQVKATAQQRLQASERLKALQKEQVNASELLTTSPDYTASVTRTPTGWQVTTGEGTIIPVESAEAARRIAVDLRQVGSQQEADALVQVIDDYYSAGKQAETVFTGEDVKGGNAGVFGVRRDASGAVIATRAFNAKAVETLRAEAEVAGIKSDTNNVFAHVNGSNDVFPMRVADGAKGVTRILNLYKSQAESQPQVITFLHENIESTWRLGMTNGTFSEQETRTAFNALLPAFEGIQTTDAQELQFIDNVRTLASGKGNDTMLRETVSEMVIRDVIGRDRDGRATGMKPGSISRAIEAAVMGANTQEQVSALKSILAAIKAFTAYLKAVFGTVDAITKARDEGKLGEDWISFVNKVLGIDEVNQMEGQAIDEAKAIMEAGNMPFSISPVSTVSIPTSDIDTIPEDLARAEADMKAGGKDWAAKVDLSQPVGVYRGEDGRLKLFDGHHRWLAARERGEPLRVREGVMSGPSFSISPIRNLNELSDQVERQFKENPAGALEVKSKVIRQFAKLADKWSNERWTPQGNKIRPISDKRTVKSLDKEQAMRQATLEGEKIAANMEASQALKEAKAEAQAWRDEADAMQKEDWSPKESLVRDLITLEAIVAMFPQEIRGKIGGFVALARKASESARLKVLQKQLERGQVLLEKHLKEQYGEAVEKLFDKYRPERKAGEKPKGKLDPDAQEIADKAESAMDLSADQTNAEIAAINVLLDADNISAEDEAKLDAMRELVQLLGDWKNADSARRESAFLALNDMLSEGWAKWKLKQLLKREQREEMRKALKSATGKKGVASERDKMKLESAKVLGKAARWVLNLSSFGEVMKAVFGEKAARQFIDNERNASNQYEDAIQDFSERIDEFFTTLAGGVLKGERLRFDLAQPTLTIGAGGMNERNISQLQGIQSLLMWQQEDGKRHMEGPRDENGAPIEGKWSYDQAWIDELTSKLSPEAIEVKKFIEQLYGEEWVPLNAVYRERHGVNLPRHDRYAPITVTPQQAKAGEMVDPVSGAAIAGSILTPGSLRSRNRSALAEPEFRDALSTFIAHTKQMEHWKAYYDLAVEMQAILGNRDVSNSVKAAVGDEGTTVLRKWVDVFAQGGTRDAAAGLAVSAGLGRLSGRVATVGLLGRFSTLLVQSTQLAAASVKMPTGAYLKRFALLMSGNLQWSDAINSEFIQRRIKSAPPIIRQAFQSLGEATRPNEIQRVTRFFGQLLSGADGLFTAGTYAILLDYHRTQGAKMGMEGETLESYAHAEAVNATEQVAQPVRTGTRSIVEVTNTNPLAKMSWAYASEARQKMALFAWSAYNAKNDPAGAAKTAFLVFVIGGLMSQVLKNLWREAKGDDDEKKWSAERLSMSMLSPITSAIPGASMLAGEGGSLSGAEYAQYAIKDVFDGKADMKDVDTLLSVAGYFNDTAGGISTLSHAGYDFAKVLENAFGEE